MSSCAAFLAAQFAHQGGWDEILLVAVPIAIIVGVLAVAKRRVERVAEQHTAAADGDGDAERRGPHDRANDSRTQP